MLLNLSNLNSYSRKSTQKKIHFVPICSHRADEHMTPINNQNNMANQSLYKYSQARLPSPSKLGNNQLFNHTMNQMN